MARERVASGDASAGERKKRKHSRRGLFDEVETCPLVWNLESATFARRVTWRGRNLSPRLEPGKRNFRKEGDLTRSILVPSFGTSKPGGEREKEKLSRWRWLDEIETCPFVWDIYTSTKEEKGSKEEDLMSSTVVPSLGTSEHRGDRQGKLSRWGWFNEVKTCPLVLDLETWTRERKWNLKRSRWFHEVETCPLVWDLETWTRIPVD
jgi:hypothetical protein